jgi:DNA-binding MarR family transcriptional regulator
MSALVERPGARPGQLAGLLHVRPNTITTVVNALARRGLVDRDAGGSGDRRAVALTVNDVGRQAVHAWQATNAAVLHIALSSLPTAQRRALTRAVPALEALADAVEQLADASHRLVPPTGQLS